MPLANLNSFWLPCRSGKAAGLLSIDSLQGLSPAGGENGTFVSSMIRWIAACGSEVSVKPYNSVVSQHPIQLGTPYLCAALSCLRRLTTGSISADVVGAGVLGVEQGKPQEFDFCFGVPLKAGDKPPDLVVHVA